MGEQIAETACGFVICASALQFDDGLVEAQGDDDDRQEIQNVLQIKNAALEILQMRHDAEFRRPCGPLRAQAPFGEEKGGGTMAAQHKQKADRHGEDKADDTDKVYLWKNDSNKYGTSEAIGTSTKIEATNITTSANMSTFNLQEIQDKGKNAYKLLQKEFSDSIKEVFEHIRDKKKEIRQDRIDNRADDGENEAFKQLKKKIKAYNIAASLIMKSYSMKINVCVKIVNKCVTCLNKVKTVLTDNKA